MKVLFTHGYYLTLDPKQAVQSKPYPPLGTLYGASYIREQSHEVALFDTNFANSSKEIISKLDNFKPETLVIYDDGFNYLTKMCLTNMREETFKLIKLAKQRGIYVIISSSDSTDHYNDYLTHGVDIVIIGEAEETLKELLNAKENEEDITTIEGIVYLNSKGTHKTKPRKVKKELDELPFPAWDLIEIDRYQSIWKKHGYFSINIATTRGCPYKCNWCAKPIYGNRYNSHSPEYIVELIKYMKNQFEFDHIWFCDDIFGLKPNWVHNFNELLSENGIHIPYKIQSRADLLLKEDTLSVLSDSGCKEIWIGAESGSQRILDAMDKGTKVEQIIEATEKMKQFNIEPCFFLQLGYLGEQWSDIEKTIQLVKELKPADIGISVSYPLPGTPFFDKVKSELTTKANWTDSDELLMMYSSTYSATLYKVLHKYIHHSFRSDQIKNQLTSSINPKLILRYLYHSLQSQIKKRMVNIEKRKKGHEV